MMTWAMRKFKPQRSTRTVTLRNMNHSSAQFQPLRRPKDPYDDRCCLSARSNREASDLSPPAPPGSSLGPGQFISGCVQSNARRAGQPARFVLGICQSRMKQAGYSRSNSAMPRIGPAFSTCTSAIRQSPPRVSSSLSGSFSVIASPFHMPTGMSSRTGWK